MVNTWNKIFSSNIVQVPPSSTHTPDPSSKYGWVALIDKVSAYLSLNWILPDRMEIIFEDPEVIDILTYQKDVMDDEEVDNDQNKEKEKDIH